MEKKQARMLVADSYFGLFDALAREIKDKARGLSGKNIVFCEEKVSLMAERRIARETGGSFNTEVYSFGNFLRLKRPAENVLTKEGAAMVVKKILSQTELHCFYASRTNLAPSLYELIIQLKSAGVTPEMLGAAQGETRGILKNKLGDVAAVFGEYERYLKENGLSDQSAALSALPEAVNSAEDIPLANVYIVGFMGFTVQIRRVISALLSRARSVTAILTGGENSFAFVNETRKIFKNLCAEQNIALSEEFFLSDYSAEGKIIVEGLFNPASFGKAKIVTDKIHFLAADGRKKEAERIACIIKSAVMRGECRYRDCTVICPEKESYKDAVKDAFSLLGIPYFFDEKKKPHGHPLITLINSYIDVFRKGFSFAALTAFIKNPLVCADKDFADRLENYLIKYNVEYGRFSRPLAFPAGSPEETESFEIKRAEICGYFDYFNVKAMLSALRAEEKLAEFTKKLSEAGEAVESAVNEQIYRSVISVLDEMEKILGGEVSYGEYKNIFASGVSAMELSIIPQYNDAVFVGGFKEAALVKAKYLFAAGLTAAVPEVKEDVALFSDGDINALSEIKVLVEPKIQVVNHRSREETALGLSAFSDKLFLSYPMTSGGKKNVKSEVLNYLEKMFTLSPFFATGEYLTEKQGLRTFASEAGRFAEGRADDFTAPACFYRAESGGRAARILEYANREFKEFLRSDTRVLLKEVTSPTAVEEFYVCPYRSFMTHGLKAKEREKGALDGLSAGVLMHGIFYAYVREIDCVTDRTSSDALFDRVKDKVISENDAFKVFLGDEEAEARLNAALEECRKFCYKTFLWFSRSDFRAEKRNLEAGFGDGEKNVYPAVPLLGGRVKLSGKIDRVDTFKDYFRVIDYKTGTVDDSEKGLFSGTKLQLYLYAAAVAAGGKKFAGAYYLPVSDAYRNKEREVSPLVTGKTLSDEESLAAQDRELFTRGESEYIPVTARDGDIKKAASVQVMNALKDYALKASENAAREMESGVIVASPYETACAYCPFSAVCGSGAENARTLAGVNEEIIERAVHCGEGDSDERA